MDIGTDRSTRAMCQGTEERRTSAPQTWTGSTRNCTRYWPSRHLTRRRHPSSHLKKLKSKESLGVQRLEREARGYHRHRVALLTESVTHPQRVLEVTDLPQAFHGWESSLKEFQRGRPAELDTNAMRHMMPKDILDASDVQPQYRTFSEIRDYMLQQALRADEKVGDVRHSIRKLVLSRHV